MWIGTHLGGLNKLDLRTNRFTVYRMKAGDPTSLPSDIVRDIIPYKDKLVVVSSFFKKQKKEEELAWWPAFV